MSSTEAERAALAARLMAIADELDRVAERWVSNPAIVASLQVDAHWLRRDAVRALALPPDPERLARALDVSLVSAGMTGAERDAAAIIAAWEPEP